MRRFKLLLSAMAVLLSAAFASAQNVTIRGSVLDQQSYPVIGATVMVPGTTNGTVTDAKGEYVITAPAGGKLQASVIGYKTQTVDIAGRVSINFVLSEDTEALEGTIVVGYGTAQKIGNIVGSVTTVSAEELTNRPSANVGDALQGKVAGLQVFNTSGEPQSSVSVQLRGTSSLNLSTAPLYILDGVPVSSSVFNDINPQDIETIAVLKDASSTAIYGSRAANGVIYISTKKGRKGETPTVSVRAQHGISLLTNYPLEMITQEELTVDTLNSIDIMDENPLPLLYQSGYLTIKGYDERFNTYLLGFPNREVEEGFVKYLVPFYSPSKADQPLTYIGNFVKDIEKGNAEVFMQRVERFFDGGDYQVAGKAELYFQNTLWALFKLLGLYVDVERHTTDGRMDILIQTKDFVYILELKIDKSADEALQQIEAKQYAKPFEGDGRTIYKIGINFSSETRRMTEWKIAST